MAAPKSHVVSVRISIAEFIQLCHEAEQQNSSAAKVLLSAWRLRNAQLPIAVQLQQIESSISELRTDNTHKFQRLADGLNQIILERR